MKSLFLVRHAKSSWDNPRLDDIARPLNSRGLKNAPEMGLRLSKAGVKPSLFISSPAVRAFETAKMISKSLIYPVDEIVIASQLFHASTQECLELIKTLDNKYSSAMLFGHNPGFTQLGNYLGNLTIDNIPTAGILALEFQIEDWKDIEKGNGKFIFFDYPKKGK